MRSRRSGFTLIELLVVIAIIAILAAILFPIMASAKEHARQVMCLGNMKQLMTAIKQYCDDYNGVMPLCIQYKNTTPDWAGCKVCGVIDDVDDGGLWRYVRNRKVYTCPTDIYYKKDFTLPLSYSMNYLIGSRWDVPVTNWQYRCKLDIECGGRSGRMLVLIHEARDRINDGFFAWVNNWDIPSDVHYTGTTVAYADSHAKWWPHTKLVKDKDLGEWMPNSLK